MDTDQLIQFFDPVMDTAENVYIRVCPEAGGPPQAIPGDSPMARNLIKAYLAREMGGRIPTDHQARSVMEILIAHAFLGKRETPELSFEFLLARDPVAQAVHVVHKQGGTKQATMVLLPMLLRIAKRNNINTTKGNWPKNEDALGKRMSTLKEPFAKRGIVLIYDDKSRPRQWTIPPSSQPGGGRGGQVADGNGYRDEGSVTLATSISSKAEASGFDEPTDFDAGQETPGEAEESCTLSDDHINALMQEGQA